MCYLISYKPNIAAIIEQLPELVDAPPHFDLDDNYLISGFTLPSHPIVVRENGELKLKLFEWGMIAPYMRGTQIGPEKRKLDQQRFKLLNARAERIVGDHKSLWYKYRKNRILIPVNGFFEYRQVPGFKNKIPYFIQQSERPLFFLPGIYNYSHLPNEQGELMGTFTIIIRAANEVMRAIHNSGDHPYRMPLMLPPGGERKWLASDLSDQQLQSLLDYELPADSLKYYPVKSLYRAHPQDPTLTDPTTYPGLIPVV